MSPRCVVVGVDGLAFNHVLPLVERGLMPHMAALLREGAAARLISSTPWQTPVGWTTYATGVNPGRHGVYGWWQPDLSSGDLRPTSGAGVQRARVWEVLSGAGLRVGVVNVPMTYPARPLNGFLIGGLDSPSFNPEMDELFTYPRTLRADLAGTGITYELMPDLPPDLPLPDLAQRWAAVERERARATAALVDRFQPDFLQMNLFLTDYLAHRAQPDDPSFIVGHQVADEIIGDLRRLAGPGARFLVISDHGSLPIDRFIMIHNLLRDLDLLHFQPGLADEQVPGVLGVSADAPEVLELVRTMRRRGPAYREALYRDLESEHPGANVGFSTIDWDRTSAFCTSDYGQIQANRVRGAGAVDTAAAAQAVLDRVRRALLDLSDGGAPLVERILERDHLYSGPYAHLGPDLTPVLAAHTSYFCQVYSFYRGGEKRVIAPVHEVVDPQATGCVGDHHPHGVLVTAGPDVPAGKWLDDASIIDLAPTILAEFGLEPLVEHEGVVLADLQGGHRAPRQPAAAAPPADDHGLRQRLRDLGYRV